MMRADAKIAAGKYKEKEKRTYRAAVKTRIWKDSRRLSCGDFFKRGRRKPVFLFKKRRCSATFANEFAGKNGKEGR